VGLGDLEREIRNRRASEFSFGPGLSPPAFTGNDPAHGGRYQPFPPAVKSTVTVAHRNPYGQGPQGF
jgi:hypothetical protein